MLVGLAERQASGLVTHNLTAGFQRSDLREHRYVPLYYGAALLEQYHSGIEPGFCAGARATLLAALSVPPASATGGSERGRHDRNSGVGGLDVLDDRRLVAMHSARLGDAW